MKPSIEFKQKKEEFKVLAEDLKKRNICESVYLYGFMVRGWDGETSDIDFACFEKQGIFVKLAERMGIQEEFLKISQKPHVAFYPAEYKRGILKKGGVEL